MAAVGSENEKLAEQPWEIPIEDSGVDVVLVDYEESDPETPLNWSPTHNYLVNGFHQVSVVVFLASLCVSAVVD